MSVFHEDTGGIMADTGDGYCLAIFGSLCMRDSHLFLLTVLYLNDFLLYL